MQNEVQRVMNRSEILQVVATLSVGSVGAAAAYAAALPAAALIGATIAVSAASFCRLPTRIPAWMRNMAFAAIGCSLGSGVDGELLELARQWPISLCGLILVMGGILYASSWILTTLFDQSPETALLASSPGALSYSLAIAATGVGDARAIIVIQSIRLLSITTALPLVLDLLHLQHGGGGGTLEQNITLAGTAGLFVLTMGFGFVINRYRIPAAYLIAGVVLSGILHFAGVVSGRSQTGFLVVGFIVTGSVIGARFTHIPLADIRRLITASFVVVLISSGIAAAFASLTARVLAIPFGQVWVAYAPGGVEAMAAMALALDYDPTFVATHHLMRIVLLICILPVLLRLYRQKTADSLHGSGSG